MFRGSQTFQYERPQLSGTVVAGSVAMRVRLAGMIKLSMSGQFAKELWLR